MSDERVDPRWEILPGDLLLSRANTTQYVGATVLVANCRRRLLLSDKSMRLVVREGVDARWLRIALGSRSARAQMSAVATGTSDSMRNISQEKVRAVRIRVPVADQQPAIIAAVERQLSVIDALLTEITTAARRSAALRRSILQRAFRGELVAQDPSDEPAYGRRDRFRAEQADDASRKRRARR